MKTKTNRLKRLAIEWTANKRVDPNDAIPAYQAGYNQALQDVCSMLHDKMIEGVLDSDVLGLAEAEEDAE